MGVTVGGGQSAVGVVVYLWLLCFLFYSLDMEAVPVAMLSAFLEFAGMVAAIGEIGVPTLLVGLGLVLIFNWLRRLGARA